MVRVANPVDVLGLSAAILGTPDGVAAQALGRATVRAFKQAEFLAFLDRHIEGSLHAAAMLNHEYRAALNDACRLALHGSAAARMAALLLELAPAMPASDPAQSLSQFKLPATHESLRH